LRRQAPALGLSQMNINLEMSHSGFGSNKTDKFSISRESVTIVK
jgi:hypothetical protein